MSEPSDTGDVVVGRESAAEELRESVAPTAGVRSKRVMRPASVAVATSAALFLSWWFRFDRLSDPLLAACFVAVTTYVVVQVLGGCFVYLQMRAPRFLKPEPGLRVDVFMPVYDESYDLVKHSVAAARDIAYPHKTYLLDDRDDPQLEALAAELGVEYRRRPGKTHAKAGNVNAALATSYGDYVVVFDVDHVAEPEFIDEVLGYFRDPQIGFVQCAVDFSNAHESWIALAAAEQCADAYGPTSMGMHGCDAAPVWGSHCTFRRTALESIGGHASGLAEDLHTSLSLHAAGWKSVFVPRVRAHGLAPADFTAAVKQQFKWARGVFDVLFGVFPKMWSRISMRQNVAYMLRCTYYLIGPLFAGHMIAALVVLWSPDSSVRAGMTEYLIGLVPFAIAVLYVRSKSWVAWPGPVRISLRWRGYVHSLFLWPTYTAAILSKLLGIPVEHIATPKRRTTRVPWYLIAPQVVVALLLCAGAAARFAAGITPADIVPVAFALGCVGLQGMALRGALER